MRADLDQGIPVLALHGAEVDHRELVDYLDPVFAALPAGSVSEVRSTGHSLAGHALPMNNRTAPVPDHRKADQGPGAA
jgi:hypothetical protein